MATVTEFAHDTTFLSSFDRNFDSSDKSMMTPSQEKFNKTFTGVWFYDQEISDEIGISMKQNFEKTFLNKHIFTYPGDLFKYLDSEDRMTSICLIISSNGVEYLMEVFESGQKCQLIYGFEHRPKNLSNNDRIYVDIDALFVRILSDIQSYETDQPPASDNGDRHLTDRSSSQEDFERPSPTLRIYESTVEQNLIQNLSYDSWKFLSFQIMSDIITEMSHEPTALEEMICECRDAFPDNPNTWLAIDDFKNSYDGLKAIYYYTQNSLIFRILSRAFRSENIERVYRCRQYVTDLHRQVVHNFELQQKSPGSKILYRGKKLPLAIIQKLIDYRGCLISLNGFLSATHKIDVALAFSGEFGTRDGSGSVVFEMHIDVDMIRPFAKIDEISKFADEEEVLLSFGSVWKIESVQDLKTYWKIVLYSCSRTDSQLTEIKRCLIHGPTLLSLGDILRKQGDLAKAERFYKKMLQDNFLSEKKKGFLYHALGLTYLERNQVDDAVKYLQMALPLIENQPDEQIDVLPPFYLYTPDDRPSRVKILNNIGLMHHNNGDYSAAHQSYVKGLEEPDETKSRLDRAVIHYNLGRLSCIQGLYETAYENYHQAVRMSDGYRINRKFQQALFTVKKYLTEQCRRNCIVENNTTDTGVRTACSDVLSTS